MKIEYEGQVYDFDLDDLDVEQSLRVEKHIKAAGVGETMLDWGTGLTKVSAPCLQALGWLILEGGDLGKPIASCEFKILKLAAAWSEAVERERAAAEEEEPDPTKPAGSSTPGTPGSTPSATALPGSPSLLPVSSTVSGLTG